MTLHPNAPKGRSLRAKAPREHSIGPKTYRVLSTTNLLTPVPGTYVKINALGDLIAEGVKVVVVE